MALDTDIYSRLQPNIAVGLGDIVNAQVDRQNKLAELARQHRIQDEQLARQNELGDIQLQQARAEMAAAPQRAAEAQRQKEQQYMQSVSAEIAANPENKDAIIQHHKEVGSQLGITPSHFDWLAQDLTGTPQEISQRAAFHSMGPEAAMKLNLQFQQQKEQAQAAREAKLEQMRLMQAISGAKAEKEVSWQTMPTATGDLVQINPKTGEIRQLGVKGKGASTTPVNQHIADAKESNALLDQVEKVGPLATGSVVGSARDVLAGAFGQSTEGAKAAAQMKVLGASLTAKVPKMSGPQSDKDVAMYKEAAGNIGNPNVPWEIKKAAIETIREINNRQLSYGNDITEGQPKRESSVPTTKSGATISGW